MPELLLELLSEEIPARMQARAAEDLKRLVTEGLARAGLAYERAHAFATPRRLALVVDGIPARQQDFLEPKRGPKYGADEKALWGFGYSLGVSEEDVSKFSQLEPDGEPLVIEIWGPPGIEKTVEVSATSTAKGIYLIAETRQSGLPASEVLPRIILDAIKGVSWPKAMRWGGSRASWVRPVRGLLVRFDRKILDGSWDLDGDYQQFQGHTYGHRFLSRTPKNRLRFATTNEKPLTVRDVAEYREKLKDAKVILDPAERRAKIEKDATARAKRAGLTLRNDPALLDEVTGLVEWPVVLMGKIDDAFMDVPPEVLVTVMRVNQKYFACLDAKGTLAPRFIVVANIKTADKGKAIIAGNERVLRARLADAKFFWDQDRRDSLSSRVPALNGIIFHEMLGSLGNKVDRVSALAVELAKRIGADVDKTRTAARLAKADLTTEMVGEFPELQGVMGRYYALHDGEDAEVANAIAEHYAPRGPDDRCPTAPISVAVALADKIDTLVGFWAIGETPTGSRDPYGLRRAALGVIRLLVENKLRLALIPYFEASYKQQTKEMLFRKIDKKHEIAEKFGIGEADISESSKHERVIWGDNRTAFKEVVDLLSFFADRLKIHLRGQGVRHDHIDAVFGVGGQDDIVLLLARVDALATFLETEDGANLLVAYRRAANIVRIEQRKETTTIGSSVSESLFRQDEEKALWKALDIADRSVRNAVDAEDFERAMSSLAALRGPVDAFFDHVTVNADDPELRLNRLRLLMDIQMTMDVVADFSQIEGG